MTPNPYDRRASRPDPRPEPRAERRLMTDDDLNQKMEIWRSNALDMILHKVAKIDSLHTKVDGLVDIQARQDKTLEKLTDAVSRLAIIEDRQNSDRGALERAFGAIKEVAQSQEKTAEKVVMLIENVENRVDQLETAETHNTRVRNTLYAAVGIVLLGILYKLLGFLGLETP